MSVKPQADTYLPVRQINEFAYCPRLFHLMHVEGLWEENQFTEDGRRVHRRIDRAIAGTLSRAPDDAAGSSRESEPDGDPPPTVQRSVSLASEDLGISGKLDLVAVEGRVAVPVETKRGSVPRNSERSWEPERVQLMAQALLLREHGYEVTRGIIYYAGSRTRVEIDLTPDLEQRTRDLIAAAHRAAHADKLPPPLESSPKCWGCSLAGICLPDETRALAAPEERREAGGVRRLYPAREDAQPLYVQEQGARVGREGRSLIVSQGDKRLARTPLKDVSELVLLGRVGVTPSAIQLMCESGVPISHFSMGHWFYGITTGITLRNAYDRAAQFAAAADPERRLALARSIVAAKGSNQRTVLRRNGANIPDRALDEMRLFIRNCRVAESVEVLLGLEGNLARIYFSYFDQMLTPKSDRVTFEFTSRNRRPPRDPVNALLSFGYAMLAKECTTALLAAGLDPFWGLFHEPRHGRPALALDLMEEFRPLVVDSAVLTAVNTGIVNARHFVIGDNACALTPSGRKKFIGAYVARLDQLVTHPIFDYRCSWRQIIRLQARLLARHLRGELAEYRGMTTR